MTIAVRTTTQVDTMKRLLYRKATLGVLPTGPVEQVGEGASFWGRQDAPSSARSLDRNHPEHGHFLSSGQVLEVHPERRRDPMTRLETK